MSKSKKRTSGRRAKAPRPAGRGWFGRVWRLALLLAGVALGLMLPWVLYLNHQVTTEFEGRKWDLPSRVYARALELYPGAAVSPGDLETELEISGYRKVDRVALPGQYRVAGGRFEIYRRAFVFPDGGQDAKHFSVALAGGKVSGLREVEGGAEISLARLDPAEIASIYPLAKEDRTLVRIQDAPPLLITGLQAVEDRNFKHHPGLDLRGIARAALVNLKAGRAVQGGSTLTQQLVKNFFLSHERTLWRKLNEAVMALLLEAHYDKAEILEAYLNEVFLGQQGAYAVHGFGRASQFYFDQPLERLQTPQVALLIGLVRGASYYNPRRHPERAKRRRNEVLAALEETGLLSAAQARSASAAPLGVTARPRARGSRYHAFVQLVRGQLSQVYREEDLKTEGLRIFTTLSPVDQEKAQAAVSAGLDDLAQRGLSPSLQGALVLADSSTGEILALVGDRYPNRAGFNRALHARRQVGSIIKPLVYLLALEHTTDYNLLTRIDDSPVSLRLPNGSDWTPANYDLKDHGEVSLLEALVHSYNQATVRLGLQLGANNLVNKLVQLGVTTDVAALPSVFLGAVELTPLEVTQIYQSLAAGGFSVPLRSVTAVQTTQGDELLRYPMRMLPQARREAISVLTYALTRVVTEGTARALPALLGETGPIAGKTGTTNDRRDSWFVGYTANRVAVTWVGEDDNRPAGVTGANAAMQLWAGLFRKLSIEPVDLRMPDGAFWLWVDAHSGKLTGEHCEAAVQMPFIDGSEPTEMTACLAENQDQNEKSFWKKLFEN
ncbi:MAG: penicillin-binding protein 1B [Xanthomonadales bacterium]|nr:penicillin-binding protein 1B [Xanthomonadales bacterium]